MHTRDLVILVLLAVGAYLCRLGYKVGYDDGFKEGIAEGVRRERIWWLSKKRDDLSERS